MQVYGASFLITFRCPSKCEHCVYNAGPSQVGHVNPNDANKWLITLAKSQQFEWLTLHGGEPFLYLDLMRTIFKTASELGIPRRGAITNGYWAKNQSKAREILESLIDAGLNRITFSVDGFHQQYINIENVKLGIEAALSLGIDKIWVDSYCLESLEAENEYDRLTKLVLAEVSRMTGVEYSLYPVDFEGRAQSLHHHVEMSSEIPQGHCELPFWLGGNLQNPEVVEIDYNGNVTLCPGICIGNAKTDTLSEVIDGYNWIDHPIIRILVERGPIGLYGLAIQHGLKPNSKFVNECHLCYEMRRLLHEFYPKYLLPRYY